MNIWWLVLLWNQSNIPWIFVGTLCNSLCTRNRKHYDFHVEYKTSNSILFYGAEHCMVCRQWTLYLIRTLIFISVTTHHLLQASTFGGRKSRETTWRYSFILGTLIVSTCTLRTRFFNLEQESKVSLAVGLFVFKIIFVSLFDMIKEIFQFRMYIFFVLGK